MTDRQALLSAAGKQRPYKAVNIKPPAMPGDIYCAVASFCILDRFMIESNVYHEGPQSAALFMGG